MAFSIDNYFKVGIIGPRSYAFDGLDYDNRYYRSLGTKILNTIKDFKRRDILGITGLGIGSEQFFAHLCLKHRIKYIGLLPYAHHMKYWSKVPSVMNEYERLVNGSENTVTLAEGHYSYKKIRHKNKKIVELSDMIIFVNTKTHTINANSYLAEMSEKLNKKFVVINAYTIL